MSGTAARGSSLNCAGMSRYSGSFDRENNVAYDARRKPKQGTCCFRERAEPLLELFHEPSEGKSTDEHARPEMRFPAGAMLGPTDGQIPPADAQIGRATREEPKKLPDILTSPFGLVGYLSPSLVSKAEPILAPYWSHFAYCQSQSRLGHGLHPDQDLGCDGGAALLQATNRYNATMTESIT